jgi:hypothetical protein
MSFPQLSISEAIGQSSGWHEPPQPSRTFRNPDPEAASADHRPACKPSQVGTGQPGTAGRSRPGRGAPSAAGVHSRRDGAGRDRGRPGPRRVRTPPRTPGLDGHQRAGGAQPGLAAGDPARQGHRRQLRAAAEEGSAVAEREDFSTLDNPFSWSTQAGFVTPGRSRYARSGVPARQPPVPPRPAGDGRRDAGQDQLPGGPWQARRRPRSTGLHSRPSAASRTVRG